MKSKPSQRPGKRIKEGAFVLTTAAVLFANSVKAQVQKMLDKDKTLPKTGGVLNNESDCEGLTEDTYIATEKDFSAQELSSDREEGDNDRAIEQVYAPGDYEFLPTELPYDELTPERSEALQKKRVMYVSVLITEKAKSDIEAIGGNILESIKKNTDGIEEFMKNCGGDLKCEIQTTITVIPEEIYPDDTTQDGRDATDFLNTNLVDGSWLDEALDLVAETGDIPRDKMYPYLLVRNMDSYAYTNFGGPGVVMDATASTHPTFHDKQQREVGYHELVKQYGFEDANNDFSYTVPTDTEGNLLYEFNEGEYFPPIKKIVSPSHSMIPGEFYQEVLFPPKVHSGEDGKILLFDRNSNTMIELPWGDNTHDAWHTALWENLDEFTYERLPDTTPPEFNPEGFSPSGLLEEFTDVSLCMCLDEPVLQGTGTMEIRRDDGTLFSTFDASESIITDNVVSFPERTFESGTGYTIHIPAGFVTDENENPSPAFDNWSLETPAITGPELAENGLSPSGVMTEDKTTFPITMEFNENIEEGSGWITLYKKSTGEIVDSFSASQLTIDGKKASLLLERLDEQTEYNVLVDQGIVTDSDGNEFSGIADVTAWEFKTANSGVGIEEETDAERKQCIMSRKNDGQWILRLENNANEEVTISLTDMLGRTTYPVLNEEIKGQWNVSNHLPDAPGMYIVNVLVGNDRRHIRKVIQQ